MPTKKENMAEMDPEQAGHPENDSLGAAEPKAIKITDLSLAEFIHLPEEQQEKLWSQIGQMLSEEINLGSLENLAEMSLAEFLHLPEQQQIDIWWDQIGALAGTSDAIAEAVRISSQKLASVLQTLNDSAVNSAAESLHAAVGAVTDTLAQTEQNMIPLIETIHAMAREATAANQRLTDFMASEKAQEVIEHYNAILPFYKKATQKRPRQEDESPEDYERLMIKVAEKMAQMAPIDRERQDKRKTTLAKKEKARNVGAIMDGGPEKLGLIVNDEIGMQYLTNEQVRILKHPFETYQKDDNGQIVGSKDQLSEGMTDIKPGLSSEELVRSNDVYTAFLIWTLSIANQYFDLRETNSTNAIVPIYIPDTLEKWHIDFRRRQWSTKKIEGEQLPSEDKPPEEQRLEAFMRYVKPLLGTVGITSQGLYEVLGFHSFDRETEVVRLTMPYAFKLLEIAALSKGKHEAIRDIFHADIMTENQAAVEVSSRIAMGLIRRGVTRRQTYKEVGGKISKKTVKQPDGTKVVYEYNAPVSQETQKEKPLFYYSISFERLIEDCPQLSHELDEIRNEEEPRREAYNTDEEYNNEKNAFKIRKAQKSQRINKKLKDVFSAAIRIILEKSDAPQYYKDLKIWTEHFPEFRPPTNSTLGAKLFISHDGKNQDYVNP